MRSFAILIFLVLGCKQPDKRFVDNDAGIDNSDVTIYDDSLQFYLKRCQVTKKQDSIFINFSDTAKHSNWYELDIINTSKTTNSFLKNTFSVTDSSYKPPRFQTISQNILTNKNSYSIGDSIQGDISIQVLSFNLWPEVYADTLFVKGSFKTIVQ